jgi:hypothetical protein
VVVVNADGTRADRVGGRGYDTAEFVSALDTRYYGDTLAVLDGGRARVSFFLGRKLVGVESYEPIRQRLPAHSIYGVALLADGSMLGNDHELARLFRRRRDSMAARTIAVPDGGVATSLISYVRFRRPALVPRGSPISLDTIGFRVIVEGYFRVAAPDGMSGITGNQPWLSDDLFAMAPSGDMYVQVRRPISDSAGGASYYVLTRNLEGKVYEVAVPYVPVPVTEEMVDAWVADYVVLDSVKHFPSMAAACSAVKGAV